MVTTIGIFGTQTNAESALHELRSFGVPESDISYVYMNIKGDIVYDQSGEKVASSTTTGIATGAVLGAVLGFVVANGILPGIGSLIVAGPIAAGLGFTGAGVATVGGAITGAAAGGLIGVLGGLGVSDEDAVRYQDYVKNGDVLIVVRGELSARDVFLKTHALEVKEYSK